MRSIHGVGLAFSLVMGCQSAAEQSTAAKASASVQAATSAPSASAQPQASVTPALDPVPAVSASSAPPVPDPIPEIPEGRSPPPSVKEWQAAQEVNTQGPHSQAQNCEMKVVREWLKVYCHGDIIGHTELENFGEKSRDFFVSVRKGKSADFVVRLRKGKTMKVKVQRQDAPEAVLFVSWPHDKDKPVHIALGRGKPPEKEPSEDDAKGKGQPAPKKRR